MNNLAIIPARGGSIRIPDKNIKDFFGKPILAYSIETARNSKLFEEVMVSTDSTEIASIAQKYGAALPFLRTQKNSDNYATLTDVLLEVIQNYVTQGRKFHYICCILPTAPLVKEERLAEAFRKLCKNDLDATIPVVKFSYPIQRALKEDNGLLTFREPENIKTRSQDLNTFYHDSGQFYWIKSSAIVEKQTIFTERTGFIELPETEVQDVDNMSDWEMLKLKYKLNNNIT